MLRTTLVLAALAGGVACSTDRARPLRPPPGPHTGEVAIHEPARLTGLITDRRDDLGQPLHVPCATCHALRTPARLPSAMSELRAFHQGMTFGHGPLPCGACHTVGDQRSLHAADGQPVALRDAIVLCRQCHGPQARDYDHGAHGGMTGHWDLSAGGRSRNHCVECHDPHVPRFQPSRPVLRPTDRGLIRHASPATTDGEQR